MGMTKSEFMERYREMRDDGRHFEMNVLALAEEAGVTWEPEPLPALPEPPMPELVWVSDSFTRVWVRNNTSDNASDNKWRCTRSSNGSPGDWYKLISFGPLQVLAEPIYWRIHPEYTAVYENYRDKHA